MTEKQTASNSPFTSFSMPATFLAILIAGCLLCTLTLAGTASGQSAGQVAGSETTGVTADKIVIGACLPASGQLQERGRHIEEAANAYFSYVNEQGGVNGRKIELLRCDDGFDPEKAIACFNSCLKDKVFAQAFCIGSPSIIKYIRMCELQSMPLVGILNGTAAAYEKNHHVFILRPSYADEAEQQIKQLWDVQHLRRIALIFESDAFGSTVRRSVLAALRARQGDLVKDISYSRGGDDLNDALATVFAGKPEATIIVGHSGVMPTILRARKAQNWPQVCLTFSSLDDAVGKAGADGEDVVITQVAPRLDERFPAAALYLKLQKKYYPHSQAEPGGYESFLNAMVIVAALKRCGPQVTRSKFVDAYESLHNFDLGAGDNFKVNFSASSHQAWSASSIYFCIMKHGKLVPMTNAEWARLVQRAKQ